MYRLYLGMSKLIRQRRNIELALIIIVILIGNACLVLVELGVSESLHANVFIFAGIFYCAAIIMHTVIRFYAANAEPFIFPIALLLNSLGIAEIYRIDIENKTSYGTKQIIWSILSLLVASVVIVTIRNYRVLQRYTYLLGLVSCALLLLPILPGIGESVSGARIWIKLGGLSFQPGELVKITLAIFFASYLYSHRETLIAKQSAKIFLSKMRNFAPIFSVWILCVLIIAVQRDLGTGVLYFALFIILTYLALSRMRLLIIGGVMLLAGTFFAARIMTYVGYRIDVWLNAFDQSVFERAFGGSYQLVQGIFGMAFGGLLGTGLGRGYPSITPLPQSDYILASLGEELGLAGFSLIMIMYMTIFFQAIKVALEANDEFAKLLTAGLGCIIAVQVFIVAGGITRVIPLTGLTAPFLASGGSSLFVNWIIVSLIIRISDNLRNSPALNEWKT